MNTLPETLTFEERKEYCRNYKEFVQMFGQEVVDELLAEYPVRKLVDTHEIYGEREDGEREA